MLRYVTHAAFRLDQWLQAKLGRPYNVLLSVGLVTEIVRRLAEIPERLNSAHQLIGTSLTMAMETALLVHQVGALSHHMEARRGRRSRPDATTPEAPSPEA